MVNRPDIRATRRQTTAQSAALLEYDRCHTRLRQCPSGGEPGQSCSDDCDPVRHADSLYQLQFKLGRGLAKSRK